MGCQCEFDGLKDRQIALQISNGVRDIKRKEKLWEDDLSLDNVIKKCHLNEQLLDTRKMLYSTVHNSNNLEKVGTPSNHNPDDVVRCHSNAENHHSGNPHNMVVEYHITDHRKVPKSVWLVLAGRLHRLKCVVSVQCPEQCHVFGNTLFSDNGPQFSSEEFKSFSTELKFEHVTSDPTYPQSNGLAERAMQTAKQLIKKCREDKSNVYIALMNLRNTPCKEGRRTKTLFPTSNQLLKPTTHKSEEVKQQLKVRRNQSKQIYNQHTKPLK